MARGCSVAIPRPPRKRAPLRGLALLWVALFGAVAGAQSGAYNNQSLAGAHGAHDLFALLNDTGATANGIRRFENGQQVSFVTFASETPLSYAVQPDGIFRVFKPGGFDSGPTGTVALQGGLAVYQRQAARNADGQVPPGYAALRLSLARGSGLSNAQFQGDYFYGALLFNGTAWRNVVGQATANGAGQFTLVRGDTTGTGPFTVASNGEVALGNQPRGAASIDTNGDILLQTVDVLAGRDPLFPSGAQGLAFYLRRTTGLGAADFQGVYRVHRLVVLPDGQSRIEVGEILAGGPGVFWGEVAGSAYTGRLDFGPAGAIGMQGDSTLRGQLATDGDIALWIPPAGLLSTGAGRASLEIWARTAGGGAIPGDRDGDGLSDAEEAALGTDPDNPDTDGDGLIDSVDPRPLVPDNVFTATLSRANTTLPADELASFFVDMNLNSSDFPFFDWNISSTANWIQILPDRGSGDASVRVTVDPRGFTPAGSPYTAELRVTAPHMRPVAPVRLTVEVVQGLDPATLTPDTLTYLAAQDGIPPLPQALTLSTGSAWRATSTASWLTVSPDAGTGNATLSVAVDPEGLAATGSPHTAALRITTNQPATVAASATVRLDLFPPRPVDTGFGVASADAIQTDPAVAVSADPGAFAVAWLETGVVYGALMDSLGGPLVGRTPISVAAIGPAFRPMAIVDPARAAAWFLWEQRFGEDLRTGIQARTLNLNTRQFGNPFGLAAAEGATSQPRAIHAPGLDSLLIAYVLRDEGLAEVRLLRYALATRTVLRNDLVAITPETGFAPDVAHDPASGRALVVWSESRAVEGDVFARLHWQAMDPATGQAVGPPGTRAVTGRFAQPGARVVWAASEGQFTVVWVETATIGGTRGDLNSLRIGPNGAAAGEASVLAGSVWVGGHAVAYSLAGMQGLPVWSEVETGNRGSHRRTTPGDFFLGPVARLPFSGGGQFTPAAAYNPGRNEFLVAWQEAGVLPAQIHAVRLSGGSEDEDGDGLPNDWELRHGLDPFDATGENGADGDPDGDGLTNLQEYQLGTHPRMADTDGDGLWDGQEDANRNGQVDPGESSPLLADTDGDGADDMAERLLGTDPTNPADRPGSGIVRVASGAFRPGEAGSIRIFVHAAAAGVFELALNPDGADIWNAPAGWVAEPGPGMGGKQTTLSLPQGTSVLEVSATAPESARVPGEFRFILSGPDVTGDTLTARIVPARVLPEDGPDLDTLALRHAPVIRMHRDAHYPPIPVETTLAAATLAPRPGVVLPGAPEPLDLMQSPQAEGVLAVPADTLQGLRSAFAALPEATPTVYYAAHPLPLPEPLPEEGPVPAYALQYYIHWFADEWGQDVPGGHRHAGDWEMAQVLIDTTGAPIGVTATRQWRMARDGAGAGGVSAAWSDIETQGGTHPVFFAGRGSNSLDLRPGALRLPEGVELCDGVGPWYLPDSAEAATTHPDAATYALTALGQPGEEGGPRWLAYAGRWGQPDFPQDPGDLPTPATRGGPEGPLFMGTAAVPSFWMDPLGWAEGAAPLEAEATTTVRGLLPEGLAGETVVLLDARGRVHRAASDPDTGAFALEVPTRHYSLVVVRRDDIGRETPLAGAVFPTGTATRNLFPTLPLDTDLGALAWVDGLLTGSDIYSRTDADGNGVPDAEDPDQDGDGVLNAFDPDALGDGWEDAFQTQDPNRNGLPRYYDDDPDQPVTGPGGPDLDGDGIPDALDLDWDNDGFTNAEELRLGTDPRLYFDFPGQRVGDLDQNGVFNAVDLQRLVNIALRRDAHTPLGDLNGDGNVDASDLQALLNRILEQ